MCWTRWSSEVTSNLNDFILSKTLSYAFGLHKGSSCSDLSYQKNPVTPYQWGKWLNKTTSLQGLTLHDSCFSILQLSQQQPWLLCDKDSLILMLLNESRENPGPLFDIVLGNTLTDTSLLRKNTHIQNFPLVLNINNLFFIFLRTGQA